MFKSYRLAVLTVIVAGSVLSGADAEEVQYANYASLLGRVELLEAEIAEVRASGADCDLCDGYCNVDCGWYAGVEAVVVKPFFEDGVAPAFGEPGYDLKVSPRFWLGYTNPRGLGVRVRYWTYDARSELLFGLQTRLQLDVVDLEVTQSVCWGPVQANFFAGVRYARIVHQFVVGANDQMLVEGVGPSFGVETRVPLCSPSVALIGNLRNGFRFGHADTSNDGRLNDQYSYFVELQLGLEYSRCARFGRFRAWAVAEAQSWENSTENPFSLDTSDPDSDLGMLGFTLGAELLF